jgi:hypothetical protein
VFRNSFRDIRYALNTLKTTGARYVEGRRLRVSLADRLSKEKHPRSLATQSGPVRDDAGKVPKASTPIGNDAKKGQV